MLYFLSCQTIKVFPLRMISHVNAASVTGYSKLVGWQVINYSPLHTCPTFPWSHGAPLSWWLHGMTSPGKWTCHSQRPPCRLHYQASGGGVLSAHKWSLSAEKHAAEQVHARRKHSEGRARKVTGGDAEAWGRLALFIRANINFAFELHWLLRYVGIAHKVCMYEFGAIILLSALWPIGQSTFCSKLVDFRSEWMGWKERFERRLAMQASRMVASFLDLLSLCSRCSHWKMC